MSHSIRIRDVHDRSYLLTETGMVETGKNTQYIVLRRDLYKGILTDGVSPEYKGSLEPQTIVTYTYDLQRNYTLRLRPSGALAIGCRRFNRATGLLLRRWATYGVSGPRGVGNRK